MLFSRIISILVAVVLPFSAACAPVGEQASVVPAAPIRQTPVNFMASGITADPAMVLLGQMTKIDVQVTSTADKTCNCTVYLNVDGVDVKSQNVTLDGRASQNVTFYYYSSVTGNHTLRVGESTFTLMVHLTDPNAEMNHAGMPGM